MAQILRNYTFYSNFNDGVAVYWFSAGLDGGDATRLTPSEENSAKT